MTPEDAKKWVATLGVNPTEAPVGRVICIPHAGAGPSVFFPWSKLAPPQVQVCGLRLPGRENRLSEEPSDSFNDLLPHAAEAVSFFCDRPYVLYGHCSGALMAFELSRHLQPAPRCLIVSGRGAPHADSTVDSFHDLPYDDLLSRLVATGGMHPEIMRNDELLAVLEPILRADLRAAFTYDFRDGSKTTSRICVIGGRDDAVSKHTLLQWSELTDEEFTLHLLPGEHFFSYREWLRIASLAFSELEKP